MRFLLITLFLSNILSAQNLVINPGFEENGSTDQEIIYTTQLQVANPTGWISPTDGTSDILFYPSNAKEISASPKAGIHPYEGNSCAGFLGSNQLHEYVEGTLEEPLTEGEVYTVSFAIAAQQNTKYDPARIGIFFSRKEETRHAGKGYCVWPEDPMAVMDTAGADESVPGWTVYSFLYKAKGDERCFVIGDFTADISSKYQGTYSSTYFFIDSIFIGKPEAPEVEEIEPGAEEPSPVVANAEPETEPSPADTAAIAPGKTLVANNIYFETGKSRILPESYSALYDIIVEMKLQPNLKVEIVGHTDSHGDKASNQKLSEDRAKAVADFFISKGIDPSRITTRGAGSSQPVGDDDQKNRRVEFNFSE